jgi:hypothetical protein
MGALVSQKQTLEQSECDHVAKVLEWGFDNKQDFQASKWGCTKCSIESDVPPKGFDEVFIDHSNCKYDPCFGCKAKNLQLNAGDATRDISDKKWQGNLAFYRQARADGIQPNGTHPVQVEAAYKASETLGKAYDGGTMTRADKVTKSVASIMKETGDI